MMKLIVRACVVVLAVSFAPVLADTLTVKKTGEVISGRVERNDQTYSIVTPDGQTQTFARDDVKIRWECDLTDAELLDLVRRLDETVRPAFLLEEPLQRIFSASGKTTANDWSKLEM